MNLPSSSLGVCIKGYLNPRATTYLHFSIALLNRLPPSLEMAQTTNALLIKNAHGVTQEIFQPNSSIDTSVSYTEANVKISDHKKSFYVVYSEETYRSAGSGTALVPSDPVSGSSDPIQTAFSIRSAQGFDLNTPGLVMFQHNNYLGYGQQFRSKDANITDSFPTGQIDGASSFICTGGEWKLHTTRRFRGRSVSVTKGQFCNLSDFGLDDKVKSVHQT